MADNVGESFDLDFGSSSGLFTYWCLFKKYVGSIVEPTYIYFYILGIVFIFLVIILCTNTVNFDQSNVFSYLCF